MIISIIIIAIATISIGIYELVFRIIQYKRERRIYNDFKRWSFKVFEKQQNEPKKRTVYDKPYISKLILKSLNDMGEVINTVLFVKVQQEYYEKYNITIKLPVFQELLRKMKKLNLIKCERISQKGSVGGCKYYYSIK